jgi:hypothetical protein
VIFKNFTPYSVRTGKRSGKYDLETFKDVFMGIYNNFLSKSYFVEYFGFHCVDLGFTPGKIGYDVENYFLRKLKKRNMWPLAENISNFSEEDLFDVIELLFHCISKPLEEGAHYHSFSDCGWHYEKFAKGLGWYEYQQEINEVLKDYGEGYEINRDGEIIFLGDPGLHKLLESAVPNYNNGDVDTAVQVAIRKFRNRASTVEDKKDAVRDLADCFEQIRDDLSKVITTKDERDLFNIANNFAIRHKNESQKTNYDKNIWLSWMFYFYLSTLHASIRLLNKYNQQ